MNNLRNAPNHALPALGLLLLLLLAFAAALYKQQDAAPANWVEGWHEIGAFQYPRRALAASIVNNYLYVIGGVDDHGQYVRPVEYASILDDGTLGSWHTTTSLQEGRFYLAAVSDNGYLYALGGGGGALGDDNVPLASVERARILPDGSLGPWQLFNYMTTPRRGLKATVIDHRIYAVGGYNGRFLKSTERLDLDTTTPPQWQAETQLAQIDRYIHAMAATRQRLYLLGGHVEKGGPMSYGDVESAVVGAGGQLEPWSIAKTRLLMPRFIASAFAFNDHLYLLGGHDGVRRLASVEMAPVAPSGEVGVWQQLSSLNHKRSATAVAVSGTRVYVAGGMDDLGVLSSVEMASLGPGGRLGNPSLSPAAER